MSEEKYFQTIRKETTPPTYLFFDGQVWRESKSKTTIPIISPIDNAQLGSIQQVTELEIHHGIKRAIAAQKEWQHVPMIKRAKILHLAADWLREHEAMMTLLLMKEIGKIHSEAKDEILRSADIIEYFAHEGLHVTGEELSSDAFPGYDQTKMAIVERVPVGVVCAIAPFNYPVNLAVSKIAPALVAGNSVLYKPPTQGSIISLYLTEIFHLAGLPKGLIMTATGEGAHVGDTIVSHPDVAMIAFTGSSDVGKAIAVKAGMIPLLFECGGNNPAIVLPDANIEGTATEIVKGAFSYAGQRCTAIKYVLGLPVTLAKLIPCVVAQTKNTMKVGDPLVQETTIGPVISDAAAQSIEKRILTAIRDGARIVLGGKRNGRYIEPTILSHATGMMDIVAKETFGPVVSFITISSMEEAVSFINASSYGLQASIFTTDEGAGIRIGKLLAVGTVQINSKPQRGPDHFPFLGIKGSGVGVQGIRYSLEAMTRLRSIVLNAPT